jgi:bifunctional UDP-N-acetylglucosamine pyrophosphorylase/glucosamine-1-phosphate N-acetyltransferase
VETNEINQDILPLDDISIRNDIRIFIIQGDVFNISASALDNFIQYHKMFNYDITSLVSDIPNKEYYDININTCVVKTKILKSHLSGNSININDIYKYPLDSGERVYLRCTTWQGFDLTRINTNIHFSNAVSLMKHKINSQHMENGVIIIDPQTAYIDYSVTIEPGVVIHPNVTITGNTHISEGCVIGSNSSLNNMRLGAYCNVQYSVLTDSVIGGGTSVGPFAYVRPNSDIGTNCKIGDFVEVKNSRIGDGSKASHLTYIGDSHVGSKVNFGCGTVTVNYDGKNKHQTTIGDDVFIGCNANLVAPVNIENGAFIAAGSTITDSLPNQALGIARGRQYTKLNWNRPK